MTISNTPTPPQAAPQLLVQQCSVQLHSKGAPQIAPAGLRNATRFACCIACDLNSGQILQLCLPGLHRTTRIESALLRLPERRISLFKIVVNPICDFLTPVLDLNLLRPGGNCDCNHV